MNSIRSAFENGKTFIPFITGGDPDMETTALLIREMAAAGADLIEIGIPFSDPIAEGPVIQAASQRALTAGCTVDRLFDMVETVRESVTVPLLFMTYANPVFSYGADRFMERCSKAGISGLIVPDVPFEEKDEFSDICQAYDVAWISMISPTSGTRAEAIAKEADGFLYCVSSLGVTGVRTEIHSHIADIIRRVKAVSQIPCAVGFGIATPEQAKTMAACADGVIVGSAIVQIIAQHGRGSVPAVREYVKRMKDAVRDL